MTELDCNRVRAWLTEDEGERPPGVAGHLSGCEACRAEAARLAPVLQLLRADAEVATPARLDLRVRAMLLAAKPAARPFFRPGLATGLAAVAVLALLVALSTALAAAGAAEHGPLLALLIVAAYLVVSSVTSLPLLLYYARPRPAVAGGWNR